MDEDRVFVLCLNILRWLGLSFTRMDKSPTKGHFVATHSKLHLFINIVIVVFFLYLFAGIDLQSYIYTESIYRASSVVYPLYTKVMILSIVAFSVCGNIYNRKFVDIINHFRRVSQRLEVATGHRPRRKGKRGFKILIQFFVYLAVITGLNIWADVHITVHYSRTFRFVHYFCFFYVTLFTAHFVVTMDFIWENFRFVNGVFGGIVRDPRRGPATVSKPGTQRKKLGIWMKAFMELREVETLVNEVFGKQIFLTLVLVFSSVIVNVYYMIILNLYETSYWWLNVTMFVGFFQSVVVALVSTKAVERAASEANRVNEVIFWFPVGLKNCQMQNQVIYFVLFNYYHPMEFRAWIFYSVNYDSLFKVLLTSSAITAVILQCDFMRGTFKVPS